MDTHSHHYLGTNDAPSTEEIDQIDAYLPIKEKQLAEIQLSLEEISHKRDSLREYQAESDRALISPARRLPCELIEEIFLQCLPSKSNAVISSSAAPIKLTHICSAWRDIAVSCPPLWSSIHIPFENYDSENSSVMTYDRSEVVELWLQRSGSCPLSISVSTQGRPFSLDIIDRLSQQLLSVSDRWKNIYFQVTTTIFEKLSKVSPDSLRNLETLHIENAYSDDRRGVYLLAVPECQLWQAPNLQKLTLGYTEEFLHLPLRWGQFTELDFGLYRATQLFHTGFPPARALWLLSQTTNLVKFNFALDKGEDCSVITAPVVLLHLKYFGVQMEDEASTIIFKKLQLPSLKHIKYMNLDEGKRVANSHPILLLLSSVGPTVPSVESMVISDPLLTPEVFKSILHLAPRLLQLSIDFRPGMTNKDHNPDLCIHLLICPSDPLQCLSPLLERLTIKGHGFKDTDILDVACTRSLRRGPLHIVHALMRDPFKPSTNIEEELSMLRSRGMKIRFSYRRDSSYRLHNARFPPHSWFDEEEYRDNESGNR